MTQLDTDVATLTANVQTLTSAVNEAIVALQGIVSTSSDDAAVVAANTALTNLTAGLVAAIPQSGAGSSTSPASTAGEGTGGAS